MKHPYTKLKQVRDAFASGKLNPKTCKLWIDNDEAFLCDYKSDETIYSVHPNDLLNEALHLLGIPSRPV